MKHAETRFSRRYMLAATLVAGGLATAPLRPALAALRIATPAQTTGPFYPVKKPLDQDNDLTAIQGKSGRARGNPIHVTGRVTDRDSRPVRGAVVEIWQANAFGRYHHPLSRRDAPLDPHFQGYGLDRADDDGVYRFLTIQPPPYPASATWMRPAHIHFAVSGSGFEPLITQMYFAGDPHLERDYVFSRVADPAARARLVVALAPPTAAFKPATAIAVFDIVLGDGA